MTPPLSTERIPEQLTDCAQWVCWREDERDGTPTKVPIKPYRTSGTPLASATDPETWRDFETALAFHHESGARTDGIGFVFSPAAGIVGVDLDDCRDPDSEELEPWASEIVECLDSYTEVSPSGTGIHVLVHGELPAGRNRRGDVEIYDRDRFFTVTGAHVSGTPTEVVQRQDALLAVHHEFVQTSGSESRKQTDVKEYGGSERSETAGDDASTQPVGPNSGLHRKFGRDAPRVKDPALEAALHGLSPEEIPEPVPQTVDEVAGPGVDLPDGELLRRATESKSGETVQALLDGDTSLWRGRESRYPSQSEADMGLCFYLAFWTGGDPERMDRLFRESGLMREKWDRRHYANGATYGGVTIARSLLRVDDYYDPPAESVGEYGTAPPTERPISGVPPVEVDDENALADAQRLATKVKQQERELAAKREQIQELEEQVQWYRWLVASVDVESSAEEPVAASEADGAQNENFSSDATATDEPARAYGIIERLQRWLS